MGGYYRTDALVCSSFPIGETDRILTLFTRDLGLIKVLATSIRNGHAKLRGHMQKLNQVHVIVTPGKRFWRLTDADVYVVDNNPEGLPHKENIMKFLFSLVYESEANEMLWDVLCTLRQVRTRLDSIRVKGEILKSLGLWPDGSELSFFFSSRAQKMFSDQVSSLGPIPIEDEMELGIRNILLSNHIT